MEQSFNEVIIKHEEAAAKCEEKLKVAYKRNVALEKGIVVGKVFSIPTGDGHAFYEIMAIQKTLCRIKWRPDLDIDEWQDCVLGNGGRFRNENIERIILMEEKMDELIY